MLTASGTAFLAYMTRVSSNIVHPRAWIHTQFAVANIASAILVSSNPTNLVLTGAFNIKFIHYTANMIVPVVATAIVLFPFLLYIVFAEEALIPVSIEMHQLPVEVKDKDPVNPNIPHARANLESTGNDLVGSEEMNLLSLEEIMHPFVDAKGAAFGAIVMTVTLIALLALNAANQIHEVFWVTLPAAVVMFCWDVTFGWLNRHRTRKISREGRQKLENALAEQLMEENTKREALENQTERSILTHEPPLVHTSSPEAQQLEQEQAKRGNMATANAKGEFEEVSDSSNTATPQSCYLSYPTPSIFVSEKSDDRALISSLPLKSPRSMLRLTTDQSHNSGIPANTFRTSDEKCEMEPSESSAQPQALSSLTHGGRLDEEKRQTSSKDPATLVSLATDAYMWLQETFPTATTVVAHLPFALVPFAFSMFILVQALVTKGWVPVFAHGWDHWVNKTGTIGSIGGMGFLSVVLCNVSLIYPHPTTSPPK